MAEPIGIASGLAALTALAFQSSVSLFQLIESFHNNQRQIRELKGELEALQEVLQSLESTMAEEDVDLSALNLPVLSCGRACQEFHEVVRKCTSHSEGNKRSLRDWAKLKYMGSDVVEFKNMLAGYKSTITIALGNANLRRTTVTASALEQYQQLVANTTCDLQDHLRSIEQKIERFARQSESKPNEYAAERERLLQEKESTQHCLNICAQVSKCVREQNPAVFEDIITASDSAEVEVETHREAAGARRFTADMLEEVRSKLAFASSDLAQRMQRIDGKLGSIPSTTVLDETLQDLAQARVHQETVAQCISICANASEQATQMRTNTFEDVMSAEDSHQLIVATLGDLISARRVTAKPNATQWLGQMSDASLQQLAQARGLQTPIQESSSTARRCDRQEGSMLSSRYGEGHVLG